MSSTITERSNGLSFNRAIEISSLLPAPPKIEMGALVCSIDEPQVIGVVIGIKGIYFDEENWAGATWEYQVQTIDNPQLIRDGCRGFDMYTTPTAMLENEIQSFTLEPITNAAEKS